MEAEQGGLLDAAGALGNNLGPHLHEIADYATAGAYLERALGIWERVLAADHPALRAVRENLAQLRAAHPDK